MDGGKERTYDNAGATRAMRDAWSSINYTLATLRVHKDDVALLTSVAQELCAERLLTNLDGRGLMPREDVALMLANRSALKGALSARDWSHWKHQNPDLSANERAKAEAIDKYMTLITTAMAEGRIAETKTQLGKANADTIWAAISGRAYGYAYSLKIMSMFTQLCAGVTIKVQRGK